MPDARARRRSAHVLRLRELAAREAVDAVRYDFGLFGAVLATEALRDERDTDPPGDTVPPPPRED